MKNLLATLLAVLLLSGCASPAQIESEKRPLSMSTMMDVPAGMFQALETDYPVKENALRTDIQITVAETHFGTQWAPMVSLCLRHAASQRSNACLQFFVSEREGKIQPREFLRPDISDQHSIRTLNPRYGLGETLNVSIREADGKTSFWVNEQRLFETPAFAPQARLEFSCSSMTCNVEFPK